MDLNSFLLILYDVLLFSNMPKKNNHRSVSGEMNYNSDVHSGPIESSLTPLSLIEVLVPSMKVSNHVFVS